jgi:thiamine-phosphate pyrophosphorylase
MAANQPSWPRQWLMTDERIGDGLWEAINRLPRGKGGIVFRHYSLEGHKRALLGAKIAALAEQRDLTLAIAGSTSLAEQLGAALAHNPDEPSCLPLSLPVHNDADSKRTRKLGAALAFISPVFGTRSHPGSPALGHERAASLALQLNCPAIVLGGMDPARFDALDQAYPDLFHGFAGIDCWLGS